MHLTRVLSLGGVLPLREGSGNPLQYSYLGSLMERGAWWTDVHGVAEELDMTQQLNNNKWELKNKSKRTGDSKYRKLF